MGEKRALSADAASVSDRSVAVCRIRCAIYDVCCHMPEGPVALGIQQGSIVLVFSSGLSLLFYGYLEIGIIKDIVIPAVRTNNTCHYREVVLIYGLDLQYLTAYNHGLNCHWP